MSYLDTYIAEVNTTVENKALVDDSFISHKLAEINAVEKQARMAPIEYDSEYSNVNHDLMTFMMDEIWALHALLTDFNYVCHLTMPPMQQFNDTNPDFMIRGKLMQDTFKHSMSLKERVERYAEQVSERAEKVDQVFEKPHAKGGVEALYMFDTSVRYQLIDDCSFVKYVYAHFRDYIRKNNVHVSAAEDGPPVMNMMMM